MNNRKRSFTLTCFITCLSLILFASCDKNRSLEILESDRTIDSNQTIEMTIEPAIDQTENTSQDDTNPESQEVFQNDTEPEETLDTSLDESYINPDGQTIAERFQIPKGFKRLETEEGSFGWYLQNLPLKADGSKVKYYDGREKTRDVYLAVVDFDLGPRDLQQCADAVIRLRAEYLYENERYDEIQFHFVSGFHAKFSKWASGHGISVNGNSVSWNTNSKNNRSYESFQRYLDIVYAYASTLSLEKELSAKPFSDLTIGDVFIQGGSPGHCVMVVDVAINEETNEKVFMLAQSYMPAQDIQILKGDSDDSPWYSTNIEDTLYTPEWTFQTSDLKTW